MFSNRLMTRVEFLKLQIVVADVHVKRVGFLSILLPDRRTGRHCSIPQPGHNLRSVACQLHEMTRILYQVMGAWS
jgi:hypothetical protein